MITAAFWLVLAIAAWTFLVYPLGMIARARGRMRLRSGEAPDPEPVRVTVVLAIRNEESRVVPRLENLHDTDYPTELLDVVVVSNGSVDRSIERAQAYADADARALTSAGVRVVESPPEGGKSGALHRALGVAQGEVVVFADARQRFLPSTIPWLVAAVQAEGVGAASGRLVVSEADDRSVQGVGSYWAIEVRLRWAESVTGSVVGATGAVYAARRELVPGLPDGLILDDVFVPMSIAMAGHRVVFVPEAVALDLASESGAAEFRRKVRTLTGNLQIVRALPGLLSPVRNPLFWRYLSHRFLRVVAPVLLPLLVPLGLLAGGTVPMVLGLGLAGLYALGSIGLLTGLPATGLPAAFVLLNAAAWLAVLGRRRETESLWARDADAPDAGRG